MVSQAPPVGPAQEVDPKAQEEIKKKLEQLQSKVDVFKKKLLKKHEKDVIGICLLPPERMEDIVARLRAEKLSDTELKKRIKEEQEKINLLLLLDDQELVTSKEKFDLLDKVELDAQKMAEPIDKLIKPQAMLMSEVREACNEGKYEVIHLLGTGMHLYDKKDVLGALKVSELHMSMVIRRFEKYVVSYIAVGSLFRGDASSHDIDVAVIIDDTDVKRMGRAELKDKLMSIIRSMGYQAADQTGVKKAFHIQVYILTDFWDNIRDATPVIFTFLRDGIPLYDRGVFMPQKLLLNMGRIKPSPEAIDLHMDVGERLIDRAKGKMVGIVLEDIYYAVLNPSQSALMLHGYPPSTPKETLRLMTDVFVKKEKLLTAADVKTLDKAYELYKNIEHGDIREVKGKEIDNLLDETAKYIKKIKTLVKNLEKKSLKEQSSELAKQLEKSLMDLMSVEELSTDKNKLADNFNKLVKKGHFTKKDAEMLKQTQTGLKKASSKEELHKVRRESGSLRKRIREHIQLQEGRDRDRARVQVRYGENKRGEVYFLGEEAFIIVDSQAAVQVVAKAKVNQDGSLEESVASSTEELESAIAKGLARTGITLSKKLLDDLKKVFGADIEVFVNRT